MQQKHLRWIPLRVHSQYSILDASCSVSEIAKKAKECGFPSVALTDHGNLFGAVDFYKACKEQKIKPIIGCDLYEASSSRHNKNKEQKVPGGFSLLVLAKNDIGYRNLCRLSSLGYLEGFYYNPRVDRELLTECKEGLICIVGGLASRLGFEAVNGNNDSFTEALNWYLDTFGEDFYLELQRHSMKEEQIQEDEMDEESWLVTRHKEFVKAEEEVNQKLIAISREKGISLIATNDSHYLERKDWRAHEVLINIQSGEPCELIERDGRGIPTIRHPNPKRKTYPSHEYYFKSAEEMEELFADIPEALETCATLAEKCKVAIDFQTKHYPVYVPPSLEGKTYTAQERAIAVEEYLYALCKEGISKRYTPERLAKVQELYPGEDPLEVVKKRLEREMSIIAPKGMCDYLLIVWDFINWAKNGKIPVGPGRGSGAGSIVLYLIGVTDIEPLRFHLFFERFINPERLSYPDIDVDICMEKRGEVIQYTLEKYGKENVAQIITFGTMKAKMAVKDVGRVLNVPLSKVNHIAKLIPEDLGITLKQALEKEPDLRALLEEDEEAKRILETALILEGCIRNTGIHAAGIIISGDPLTDHIPICNSKDTDMPVTQYSMKPVEQVGMLKVDFLGLKTLTAIQKCVEMIRRDKGVQIDWVDLPLNDKQAFDLLNKGKTLGVFQLESGGMQELARSLHLDRFEEIIAVGALYRPGPMDMIPSFINRKHGREPIEYDHEWMKDILAETYGIMVYQEQVMQIAQKLANYSLGEGDVLRRAMGKKDREQMEKEREKFRAGAMENGISGELATHIFDKMEKFASYGFNKSHAAAYGYLSYATAYLKANYPGEWMASLMTCDKDDISKVSKFIKEALALSIKMLPPDVNESFDTFVATSDGIRFALSAVKGVGEGVVEAICKERKRNGHYKTLYDFIQRVDKKSVGKKVIESLVDAGCFDFTSWTRDQLKVSIEPMYTETLRLEKEKQRGVMSLFSLIDGDGDKNFLEPPAIAQKSSRVQQLLKEKELLGFFLTGHPLDSYKPILQRLSCVPLSYIAENPSSTVIRCACILESVQVKFSNRSQKKFAIATISDGMDRMEVPLWSDSYEKYQGILTENRLLYTVLICEQDEGQLKLSCQWMADLTQASEELIQACDEAYNKAKAFQERMKHRVRGKSKEEQAKQTVKIEKNLLEIQFEANSVRLSHIVKVKELLWQHLGTDSVICDFLVDGVSIAALHVDGSCKVTLSDVLEKQLKAVPSVCGVNVVAE